jgi:hypothetical protein
MPFTVCCVAAEDVDGYEEVAVIRKFCGENGIAFTVRAFDSSRYEEDALYIQKLPAFYIYERKRIRGGAFYAENDPLRRIREEILRVRTAEQEAALRRAQWAEWWQSLFQKKNKIASSK